MPHHVPIPSLLATAAVHHHLIREGTRTQCGLVIETGEARESHHFCLLIGYGAGAINPYLAFETLADLHRDGLLPPDLTLEQAKKNYIKAANKAILKVASKMGISHRAELSRRPDFRSDRAQQATDRQVSSPTPPAESTASTLDVIARESLMRHRHGYPPIRVNGEVLDNGGNYQWRRDGEYHMWNPDTDRQDATRRSLGHHQPIDGFKAFQEYSKLVQRRIPPSLHAARTAQLQESGQADSDRRSRAGQGNRQAVRHRRDELRLHQQGSARKPGDRDEPHRRQEQHRRRGRRPERFMPTTNPASRMPTEVVTTRCRHAGCGAAIKQVASARFGVTSEYLDQRRGIADQDGPGRQAGRGRTIARAQGR